MLGCTPLRYHRCRNRPRLSPGVLSAPLPFDPLAVILAIITAAMWGTSDFFGGLASKQRPVALVMMWAHGIGLVAILIAAPFLAESLQWRDLWLGSIAGIVGMVGLLLLYQSLSIGPMAVVAPLSALIAALLPVLFDPGWRLLRVDHLDL